MQASINLNPNFKVRASNTNRQVEGRFLGIQGGRGLTGEKGDTGAQGVNWQGVYDNAVTYSINDAISYQGSVYILKVGTSTGVNPTNTINWDIFVEKGDQGIIGQDLTHVHVQNVASTTWTVSHPLNKFPAVSIIDSGGTIVEGDVNYVDINTVVITFSYQFTGTVYLN